MKSAKPIIIAVDGPAAAGKGSLSRQLAVHFNLAYLDTGLLYRWVGLRVFQNLGETPNSLDATHIARSFTLAQLRQDDQTLRTEQASRGASIVGNIAGVRTALMDWQRSFAYQPPADKAGSLLDGRDIGTIICPDADVKLYITASLEVRAKRREEELLARGEKADYTAIIADMRARDTRDGARSIAPLRPAEDALVIDTSHLTLTQTLTTAIDFANAKLAKRP